jgi:hypothetical protein
LGVVKAHAIIEALQSCIGKQLIEAIDEVERIAAARRYSVNVIDPQFNVGSIDEDDRRLNVRTDNTSVITSFTIG